MIISLNLSPHLNIFDRRGFCAGRSSRIPPIISSLSTLRSRSQCIMPRRMSSLSVSSLCLPPTSGSESDCGVSNSWISTEKSEDEFGGWCIVDQIQQIQQIPIYSGFPRFLLAGIGSTIVILMVFFARSSCTRKGFNLQFCIPFRPIVDILKILKPAKYLENETDHPLQIDDTKLGLPAQNESDQFNNSFHQGKKRYNIIPVASDSTQQEALSLLQRLKIIESDVKPYELCTRREYARWLVKANLLLERDSRRRIVLPSMLIPGSTIATFNDVNVNDPDFLFIQAIGESAIVPSKLFNTTNDQTLNDGNNNSSSVDDCLFSPESEISRLDLISWKAKLEYSLLPEVDERMLRKNIGLMDLGTISQDMLQELSADTLAGDRSILRRVFGNIRRLQPLKPVTKAQAAVALTSGRTSESLQTEISRIESVMLSHFIESQEIKSDLLHNGDIPRFWEQKINQEKEHGLGLQNKYQMVLRNFNEEKIAYEKEKDDHIKERAALDCQWQLLTNLKDEVDRISERIENEKFAVKEETQNLEKLCVDLRDVQNALFETKSILEAEKEAFKILRSWVEDGVRQNQFRVKVLKDALERWKWDGHRQVPET